MPLLNILDVGFTDEFVTDMKGHRISVAVCYQALEAQVLAGIRNSGVLVTEFKEKNIYNDCRKPWLGRRQV